MLATIWFVLWGVLWAVYFILDGFDLGMGIAMPLLARDENDRRAIYQSIGPFWDGNEVWLIAAGGITFAAFPGTYAVMFSALYTPLMLLLFALILRGATLALRFEVESRAGRVLLDQAFVISSAAAAVLLGVTFANIFRGLPLTAEGTLEHGTFGLFTPLGWLGGALFAAAFGLHGCLWLALHDEGELRERARGLAHWLGIGAGAAAVFFLVLSAVDTTLWDQYLDHPVLLIIPVLAVAGIAVAVIGNRMGRGVVSWVGSAVFIAGVAAFGLAGIYPALLPSRGNPELSLTITNSASSPYTLKIMLGVALVMVPIVIAYQAWVYRLFAGEGGDYGEAGGE